MGALPLPNSDASASPVQPPIQPLVQTDEAPRCQYRDARGRGCRMLAVNPPNPMSTAEDSALDVSTEGLCAFHARRLRDRHRATQATAAELLASVSDFNDPPSVNRFLGNLLKLVAVKRVPRRDAVALAYISQLILNSQAAQDRRELMRLQIADLDAQRQKNLPTRVIWDLPVRRKPPEQEASPAKQSPSEAPQPSPVPAPPAASASAHTDSHATEPLTPPAAAPPADRTAQSNCPPAPPQDATAPSAPTAPAPAAGVPAAAPGPPKPIPGPASPSPGHTTDGFVSWAKPALKRYPYSRWY